MLEIMWFKGRYEKDKFTIYESNMKRIEYDEYINKDDVYELIYDRIIEGYYVQLRYV